MRASSPFARGFFFATSFAAAAALVLACGGQTAGSGGGGGIGGACDRLFDAYIGCTTSTLPAAEAARVRPRWDTLCTSAMALPGQAVTNDSIDACISAIDSLGCSQTSASTGPCAFTGGSLPGGTTCESDSQCQSGTCALSASSDGGLTLCGTCYPPSAVGQPCEGRSCGPNATCTSGSNGSACVATTYAGRGAACDHESKQCNPGLTCSYASNTCISPGATGSTCSDDVECASPLVCLPSPAGPSLCGSPGPAGTYCTQDEHCTGGLGCDYFAHACSPITWTGAGQPCSDTVRCLVGGCPLAMLGPGADAGAGGTCPTVIPDGQPCDPRSETTTCDTFAECANGVCALGYAGLCQ